MRLQHPVCRRLAGLALLATGAGFAAPAAAQSPAGQAVGLTGQVAGIGQAGRAFWGIPALPPQRTATAAVVTLPVTPILPEPILPEPILPEPILPEPVLPEPVLPAPIQSDIRLAAYYAVERPQFGGEWHESSHPEWIAGAHGLPPAVVESVRPAPFPYGYFGASNTRHWQRYFGFRRAYTQWTLK